MTRPNKQVHESLEIIGARLLGPPPISDVWLPLTSGTQALYGKNGAGKSRVLSALADLFEGKASEYDSYLVARVHSRTLPYTGRSTEERWGVRFSDGTEVPPVFPPDTDLPWNEDPSRWSGLIGRALWHMTGSLCRAASWDCDIVADDFDWSSLDGWDSMSTEAQRAILNEIDDSGSVTLPGASRETLISFVSEVTGQAMVALTPQLDGWAIDAAILIDESTPTIRRSMLEIGVLTDRLTPGGVPIDAMAVSGIGYTNNPLLALSKPSDLLINATTDEVDEGDAELLEHCTEVRRLNQSDRIPYRLGKGLLFEGLKFWPPRSGPAAYVVRDDALTPAGVSQETRSRLAIFAADSPEPTFEPDGAPSADFMGTVIDFTDAANSIYEALLMDAPYLVMTVPPLLDWLTGRVPEWAALADDAKDFIPISELSQAQGRWALTAISLSQTIADHDTGVWKQLAEDRWLPLLDMPLLLTLDEPDAALHTTAQRQAVDGLIDLVREHGTLATYLTTHSKEFLNSPDVSLLHVHRAAEDGVRLSVLDAPQRARVAELGLEPADLLLLHRVIVIVEGSHDVTVLGEVIGDEFDRLRALVLPMRGGRLLATVVDSHILAHFSDTPIIAALDNLSAEKVSAYWNELLQVTAGGQAAFDEVTGRHFSGKERAEEAFLIDYCRAAAELGQTRRFQVFGFSKIDIPLYLPAEVVTPGHSWADLEHEFQSQTKVKSFKPWLKQRHGIEIDEMLLQTAARSLDHIPADFVALLGLCRDVQRGPRLHGHALPNTPDVDPEEEARG